MARAALLLLSSVAARCVHPGHCSPPATKYSRVITGAVPGIPLETNGGFSDAFSTQHAALGAGAWVPQDLVRKANRQRPGKHSVPGSKAGGFKVVPSNVADTARGLRLSVEEWDHTQPAPRAFGFKGWLKEHLSKGHAVDWFVMSKCGHDPTGWGSLPSGGGFDHVEAIYGIFSEHPLDDPNVYDDDWIVHTSDQYYAPHYHQFHSLQDTAAMEGNCKDACFCFDSNVTYGLAVTGLHGFNDTYQTSISMEGATSEPNVRDGKPAAQLHATVRIEGLKPGAHYTTYRIDGTESLPPTTADLESLPRESQTTFKASGETHTFADNKTFASSSAVYYVTAVAKAAARV